MSAACEEIASAETGGSLADDGDEPGGGPKRAAKRVNRYHGVRPHNNPLSDNRYPNTPFSPSDVAWETHFPIMASSAAHAAKKVTLLDVGCGYGGLSRALGLLFPEELVLGVEIRLPVVEHVMDTLRRLREANPGKYLNVSCERSNAMRYLPAYFEKGQITKMFFLFPDPHFKKSKHKWRIISPTLLAEYAYVVAEGGLVYTITDVLDLHQWMVKHLSAHPLFQRLEESEFADDPVVPLVYNSSEESNLVRRKQNDKHLAIFRRIPDPFQGH
ncbi:MAG: tRNA (guanosine(46)-N7)-methyltransferase TrmB [archaeon]|nr:tRNA (guanosine(46)-N7)-methyltransferase TrmB [archaeon]